MNKYKMKFSSKSIKKELDDISQMISRHNRTVNLESKQVKRLKSRLLNLENKRDKLYKEYNSLSDIEKEKQANYFLIQNEKINKEKQSIQKAVNILYVTSQQISKEKIQIDSRISNVKTYIDNYRRNSIILTIMSSTTFIFVYILSVFILGRSYPELGQGVDMQYYSSVSQLIPILLVAIFASSYFKIRTSLDFVSNLSTLSIPILGECGALFALATSKSSLTTLWLTIMALVFLFLTLILTQLPIDSK